MVHAISHMVGAEFDTQHGLTNAVLLPAVLRFNAPAIGPKVAPMCQAMGLAGNDFETFYAAVSRLLDHCGIPRSLTEIGVTLHPDKFYMQHYTKGIEFVGSVLKTKRIYVHNRTINNAYEAINKLNNVKHKEDSIERFVAVINSYLGFMKNKDTYAIRRRLINKVSCDWFRYVFIEGRFEKVVIKREFRKKVIIKNLLNNERNSRISERKGRGYFRVKGHSL
jgi:alcohol dehydrogenase YqhD (iron-dependent ADH family)